MPSMHSVRIYSPNTPVPDELVVQLAKMLAEQLALTSGFGDAEVQIQDGPITVDVTRRTVPQAVQDFMQLRALKRGQEERAAALAAEAAEGGHDDCPM